MRALSLRSEDLKPAFPLSGRKLVEGGILSSHGQQARLRTENAERVVRVWRETLYLPSTWYPECWEDTKREKPGGHPAPSQVHWASIQERRGSGPSTPPQREELTSKLSACIVLDSARF